MTQKEAILDAFRRNHGRMASDTCWEWRGTIINGGYGQVKYKKKKYYVHRLSYETFVGEIPVGLLVCHHCDNRCCFNPKHLFTGTYLDNKLDSVRKGRHAHGERTGVAKLNAHFVDVIAKFSYRFSGKQLAKGFGVTPRTIYMARKGVTHSVPC